MKIMATIACIILSTNIGHSQKWDEWFKQKKTQKKYLIQQIAALKVYLGYLKEGYDIAISISTISVFISPELGFYNYQFLIVPSPFVRSKVPLNWKMHG